jgi:hypothetical protein
MSRTYAKEIFTEILQAEIDAHKKLSDDALPKASKAFDEGKLSEEALKTFQLSRQMLFSCEAALKDEDFKKTVQFLVRAVANYYLMLGDKGVLRNDTGR